MTIVSFDLVAFDKASQVMLKGAESFDKITASAYPALRRMAALGALR